MLNLSTEDLGLSRRLQVLNFSHLLHCFLVRWSLFRVSFGGHLLEKNARVVFHPVFAARTMFCRGAYSLRRVCRVQGAIRRPPSLPGKTRSLSCLPAACSHLWTSAEQEKEVPPNLDAVPSWSVDPRTQHWRPGSNWTYEKELFALARRLGHDLDSLPRLRTALTHRSALSQPAVGEEGEKEPKLDVPPEHNSRFSFLGKALLQYFVSEHLLRVYPNMEANGLADIAKFLLNDPALVKCAEHIGITDLIRSQKRLDDPSKHKIIVRALLATVSCLHLDQGPAAARKFVAEFVTSKMAGVDLHEVIKLQHPRYVLRSILASLGMPKAESRLLKETGRATHFPTFVVGVYSGEKLLGEGCGTSLKRAEREALVAALHQHFATQLAAIPVPLEGYEREGDIEFFQPDSIDSEPNPKE